MKAISKCCGRWLLDVRRNSTTRCCKRSSFTTVMLNCGDPSGCEFSSNGRSTRVSPSGGTGEAWASARKELSVGLSGAAKQQRLHGSERRDRYLRKMYDRTKSDCLDRPIRQSGAIYSRMHMDAQGPLARCARPFQPENVSAVAALTRANFLFQLSDGAIKSGQIVQRLKVYRAELEQKALIMWGGTAQHRSRITRESLARANRAMHMIIVHHGLLEAGGTVVKPLLMQFQ